MTQLNWHKMEIGSHLDVIVDGFDSCGFLRLIHRHLSRPVRVVIRLNRRICHRRLTVQWETGKEENKKEEKRPRSTGGKAKEHFFWFAKFHHLKTYYIHKFRSINRIRNIFEKNSTSEHLRSNFPNETFESNFYKWVVNVGFDCLPS